MSVLRRIVNGFKTNPRFYWFAFCAIFFTIFFFIDLALYYGAGEDYTLSASLRGTIAFRDQYEVYKCIAALLIGIWLSHIFQFGAKRPDK